MTELDACDTVRDLIPEVAAGVAAGDDRAAAMAHVARCPSCRRELAETAALVDDLLLLTPQQEPPAGFETAVLAALQPAPVRRPHRRVVALLVAAVVVAVAVAGGVAAAVTWSSTQDDRRLAAQYRQTLAVANGRYLTAGRITLAGREIGHAYGYQGTPSWIFLAVDDAPSDGAYAVVLVGARGETGIGSCEVVGGRAACGFTIDAAISTIDRIELRRPGDPTSTARFAR